MTQQIDPGDFRIVQAVQEFSRDGGTETVAFELQRAWEADGTPSSVLAAVIGPDVPASARTRVRFALPNLLQQVPTRGRWRHVGRSVLVPAYTVAASIMLRRDQRGSGGTDASVVLSHGDSLVADVVVLHAVNAANLAQKRLDHEWRWVFNPLHSWVWARDRLMLRGLRARRYVAVSSRVVGELERLHGIPRDRISVIPNGTDITRFSPDGPTAGLREACGIGAGDTMLLFVGHEFDRKGLK
ncbi:MAG: glycosyltransferase family 1 protein, partial [Lysobacteraceae bacterium]